MRRILILVAALVFGQMAVAATLDDFNDGLDPAWLTAHPGSSFTSSAAAFEGARGLRTDGDWFYRTDPAAQLDDTSILSTYFRFSSAGRVYLGFNASASGAESLVAASNTGQLMFQENPSYNYVDRQSTAFSFVLNTWYRMTLQEDGSSLVGTLFDGTTGSQLAQVVRTSSYFLGSRGVALRGFNADVDLVQVNAKTTAPVPLPAAVWMMLAALAGLVGLRRRRAAVTAA